MGKGLKYDSTRLIFFIVALAAVYLVVLPGNWPEPRITADVPDAATLAQDLQIEVTVKAWHGNFSLRQVSFAVSSAGSTALTSGLPFVPVNIYDRPKTKSWSVGLAARATWPRTRRFRLTVPLRQLALDSVVTAGELRGTVDAVVDHTRVTMSAGYPALTLTRRLPYEVEIGR